MSRRLMRTVITLAISIAAVNTGGSASAFPGGGGGQGSGGSVGGVLTASVGYTSDGASTGGDGCTWSLVDGAVGVGTIGVEEWPRTDAGGVIHHLWRQDCLTGTTWFDFPVATPTDLLPALLEQLEKAALPKPTPVFELLDKEFGWAYVRTPLDFRAGAGSWRTVSVTASIGPLWATVTARPTRLTFDPGDPAGAGSVSCSGDGPVAPYVAEVPGVCSYTYVNASSTSPYDGYHFVASLTTGWSISWTSSTGAGGPLDAYSTSTTAELAVAEVKGLVTCTGSRPEQGGC